MQLCTIFLVRHGESEANRKGTVGEDASSLLTPKGEQQAAETKAALPVASFDAAYSSDYTRAVQTASIIYGQVVPAENRLVSLRERDFGRVVPIAEWTRLNVEYDQIYGLQPLESRWDITYGAGIETDHELHERFAATILEIANQNIGRTVLIGTHGGPLRILLVKLGFAPYLTAESFKNGGYVVLTCDGSQFALRDTVGVTKPEFTA